MSARDPDAPHKEADHGSRKVVRRARNRKERAKSERRLEAGHAADDQRHHDAMAKVVIAALPRRAPGVPLGAVLEAARRNTSRRQFPGDTRRMWARAVLNELRAKGAVAEGPDRALWLRPAHPATVAGAAA